jgi:hypothetical protein
MIHFGQKTSMLVTLKNKMPLVVPPPLQRRAGLNTADKLEFRAVPGAITITAMDEYTPEQRRFIERPSSQSQEEPNPRSVYGSPSRAIPKQRVEGPKQEKPQSAMNVALKERAVAALAEAPPPVQRAFIKPMNFLARNLQHPSLRAKKYDESQNLWQARVNDDWRFYFIIEDEAYVIQEIMAHPSNSPSSRRVLHFMACPRSNTQFGERLAKAWSKLTNDPWCAAANADKYASAHSFGDASRVEVCARNELSMPAGSGNSVTRSSSNRRS